MTNTAPRVTAKLSTQDERLIRSIVPDAEDAFNDKDVEKSVRHFAEDAVVVNAIGVVLDGRGAIERATADGLAGFLASATAHYEPFAIVGVGSDVAVANKRAWASKEDAEASRPVQMLALYVLVKREGRWWIARRENSLAAA